MIEDSIPLLPEYPGLTSDEVARQQQLHGYNRSVKAPNQAWELIIAILKEPMVLLLLVACSIYFILSEWSEAFTMLGAILFVAGISLFQDYRSQRAVKALQQMTMTKAKVVRNKMLTEIPSDNIVVKDIAVIEEGDLIPADMHLLTEYDLAVNEAVLTGESTDVVKQPGDQLYQGTMVLRGYGYARVSAIGTGTRLAAIEHSLGSVRPVETPLQSQVHRFVRLMVIAGSLAFLLVWGYKSWETGSIIHGLLHGLTMAMSVIPEEIPVAMTTFLALGAYRLLKLQIIARQPQSVETLGAATVICVDKTGTLTKNLMQVAKTWEAQSGKVTDFITAPEFNEVLEYAMWSSERSPFDPMETSIHQWYSTLNTRDIRASATMLKDFPLAGSPPVMTHLFDLPGQGVITAIKGGLETVLKRSQVSAEEEAEAMSISKSFASLGFRVLGVGKGTWGQEKMPEKPEDMTFTFLGIIAFSDPPETHIPDVIKSFHEAGVEVKMITGDYLETARSVAATVGITDTPYLTGSEMQSMSEPELTRIVGKTNVFARIYPEAKLRIVQALRKSGEVVAMTGDGVNDAPALKAADIGIAMGKRGTEVAKGAAGLVLGDDDLAHMVDAIYLGRRIHANLKKAIRYIISIHIPIITLIVLNQFLPFLPETLFSPIHVIFLELIMGPTCSIIYENEPTRRNELVHPSRQHRNVSLLQGKPLTITILQGLLITITCLITGYWATRHGYDDDTQRTLIFSTLVFANVFLTLVNRSFRLRIWETFTRGNALIPLILIVSLLLWACTVTIPAVRHIFEFSALRLSDLLIPVMMAMLGTLWIEPFKGTSLIE
ncbi:MAG: cation-translocating P-type ATPase [Saprospiraceae bacterium]|nr:cation-translocating P-type ATPase [Saprospiraceae bacterium]MCB9319754.1 cation-translocating P-type ATPase [Lewinellaceae bacterium]